MKFKLSLPKLLVDGDMSSWRNPTTNWPFHHQQRSTFTIWNPFLYAEPRNTEAPPSTGVSPVSVRRPGGVSLEGAEAGVSYWSTRWEHGVVKKMGHTTRIIRKIWQVLFGNIDEKIWGDCLRYPSLYGFGSRPCHLPVQDKFIPRSSQYKLPRSSGKGRKNEWTPLPKSPPFIFSGFLTTMPVTGSPRQRWTSHHNLCPQLLVTISRLVRSGWYDFAFLKKHMDHHWDCRSWLQKPSTEIKWSKHVAKSSDSWLAAFRFVVSWTHLISLHQKKVPRATVHYLSEVTIRTILHTQVCPKILCPKIQRLHGKSSHYPHYISKSSHFPRISPKFESKTSLFFFRNTPTFPKIQRLNFQRESGGVPTTCPLRPTALHGTFKG